VPKRGDIIAVEWPTYFGVLQLIEKMGMLELGSLVIARNFPEGTLYLQPSGGKVLWIEMPRGFDCIETFNRALQKNIEVTPSGNTPARAAAAPAMSTIPEPTKSENPNSSGKPINRAGNKELRSVA